MSTAPLLALESVSKVYHRGLLDRTPAFRLAADSRTTSERRAADERGTLVRVIVAA